jgi:adenylate kinase family enzyme
VRRVSVVGPTGSGKSWLATRLASKLELPHLELDAIRHQRDWEPLPDAEFARRVRSFVSQDGWVLDGNYFAQVTEAVVWPAADTVVWVDLPKPVVMRQVVFRTLERGVLRRELWNGNREKLRDTLGWDPYRSIIRWAWTSYEPLSERYAAAMGDQRWEYLTFIRLRSRQEMRRFLEDHHACGE